MSSLLLFKSMLYANAVRKAKIKPKDKNKIKKKHKLVPSKNKTLDMSLCRICNENRGIIPIFNNKSQPHIPLDIHNFSGVMVDVSDQLPTHMCQSCLDLLNGCVMFRDMCRTTNKRFIKLLMKEERSIHKPTISETRAESGHSDNDYESIMPDTGDVLAAHSPPACSDYDLWECAWCKEQFHESEAYNTHLSMCLKSIKRLREKRPEGWKPTQSFLCDTCGKTTRSKASLSVHMLTHENVFPFKCDACPYRGRTLDLLKVHKRSHLEDLDRPYKCSQCPKATTTASNLAKHMRNVHSDHRPHKCSYCDKAFGNKHDVKRHIKDIHLRQGTVECEICFKKFNTRKILQGHRLKVHKIKGERSGRLPSYLQCRLEESETDPPENCEPEQHCEPEPVLNY